MNIHKFKFLSYSNGQNQIDACMPQQIHIALGDLYYNYMYNFSSGSGDSLNSSVTIVWTSIVLLLSH